VAAFSQRRGRPPLGFETVDQDSDLTRSIAAGARLEHKQALRASSRHTVQRDRQHRDVGQRVGDVATESSFYDSPRRSQH
jgi:hypothetical protein